jgi:hypothetical protein
MSQLWWAGHVAMKRTRDAQFGANLEIGQQKSAHCELGFPLVAHVVFSVFISAQ